MPAIERGVIQWESIVELGRIVAGQIAGRASDDDITIFKSNGIALEDIAVAIQIYNRARERSIGEEVSLWG
jgi:ornithine cyclodeaminase/alanine dehydrogenase-like protein (mu-crystallin family)